MGMSDLQAAAVSLSALPRCCFESPLSDMPSSLVPTPERWRGATGGPAGRTAAACRRAARRRRRSGAAAAATAARGKRRQRLGLGQAFNEEEGGPVAGALQILSRQWLLRRQCVPLCPHHARRGQRQGRLPVVPQGQLSLRTQVRPGSRPSRSANERECGLYPVGAAAAR